jgi:hypothetical protein
MELLNMSWNATGAADRTAVRRRRWPRRWLGVAAAALLLALSLAYLTVLRGAVQSGQSRRADAAAQGQLLQRCTALASLSLREACRLQVTTSGGTLAMRSARP